MTYTTVAYRPTPQAPLTLLHSPRPLTPDQVKPIIAMLRDDPTQPFALEPGWRIETTAPRRRPRRRIRLAHTERGHA